MGNAPTVTGTVKVKFPFWGALDHVMKAVPRGKHLFVLMDANARTGKRGRNARTL